MGRATRDWGGKGAQSAKLGELVRKVRGAAAEAAAKLAAVEAGSGAPLAHTGGVQGALRELERVQDVLGAADLVEACADEGEMGRALDVRAKVQEVGGSGRLRSRLVREANERAERVLEAQERAHAEGATPPRSLLSTATLRLRLLRQRVREVPTLGAGWSAETDDAVAVAAARATFLGMVGVAVERTLEATRSGGAAGAAGGVADVHALLAVYTATYVRGRRDAEAQEAAAQLLRWSQATAARARARALRRVRADPTACVAVARAVRPLGLEPTVLSAGLQAADDLLGRGLDGAAASLAPKFVAWMGSPRLPMSSADVAAALLAATPLAWAVNAAAVLLNHLRPLWPLLHDRIALRLRSFSASLRDAALAHVDALPVADHKPFLLALLHALGRIAAMSEATGGPQLALLLPESAP